MDEELQALASEAQDDLLSFCVFTDPYFEIIQIHEIMADALEKLERGDVQKVIFELPPRSGKSRIVREFIAKYYGDHPRDDIILTGHSASLLESFSRLIKDRMKSAEYCALFDTRIKKGNDGVNNWSTEEGGEFNIFGVGGGITGRGFHLGIIDDPYASREEAESDTVRKKVSSWYWSTYLSRLQNEKSKQIIIMQRWREDDLVGEILEKEGDEWLRVTIPAISDEGKSFWASKFSVAFLEKKRDKIGEYFFMSQYQQDPVNEGGGEFTKDMFEYYDFDHFAKIRKRLHIISFLDPAFSEKQEADFNGLITIGIDRESNYIYLLQVKNLKGKTSYIVDEVFETAQLFRDVGLSYKFGYETIAGQKTLGDVIKKEMRLRDFFFKFEVVGSQGNKVARIKVSLGPRYSTHTIIHPRFGANISKYETQLLKFPNGKNDDMIDAMSSAVIKSKVQKDEVEQEVASTENEEFFK